MGYSNFESQQNSIRPFWNQLSNGFNLRWIFLSVLAMLAFINVGCSTPVVVEEYEESSAAWNAFESCVTRLSSYGRESECSKVGTDFGASYHQQISAAYDISAYTGGAYRNSYMAYLGSLDTKTLAGMKEEWNQLAQTAPAVVPPAPWEKQGPGDDDQALNETSFASEAP